MHDNDPFQNIKDHHRQNLNEVGDTFKGKLNLAGYAARRGVQLIGLQRQEKKIQKEKEGLMDLIRSGNAPPLSYLNKVTDQEYKLQTKGDRMARGIRSALGSIRGEPIREGAVKETKETIMTLTEQIQLKEYYKARLQQQLIDEGFLDAVRAVGRGAVRGVRAVGRGLVGGTEAAGSGIAKTGEAIKNNPRKTLGTLAAAAALGYGAYKFGQQNPTTPSSGSTTQMRGIPSGGADHSSGLEDEGRVRRPDGQVRKGPSGEASWAKINPRSRGPEVPEP